MTGLGLTARATPGEAGASRPLLIEGASVVTPHEVLHGAAVAVEGGRIAAVGSPVQGFQADRIDASGLLLMPGIVDLHSDALERAIEPRPGAAFPLPMAIVDFDRVLAGCGVTTMFHCVAFAFTASRNRPLRTNDKAVEILRTLKRLQPGLRVRTRIHARYDLLNAGAAPLLEALAREGLFDLLSFMDHTPGQGQYRDLARYREVMTTLFAQSAEQVEANAAARAARSREVDPKTVGAVARACRESDIPLASHDDDSPQKVAWAAGLGVTICEFPVTVEAMAAAEGRGMHVVLGAPNLVRGGSQSGNLSARDAVEAGACDVLCSDYAPMTMLQAVFEADRSGLLPLHEAAALVSLNAAAAVGAGDELGSIEPGKLADLVLVDRDREVPQVLRTWVGGREVYGCG